MIGFKFSMSSPFVKLNGVRTFNVAGRAARLSPPRSHALPHGLHDRAGQISFSCAHACSVLVPAGFVSNNSFRGV